MAHWDDYRDKFKKARDAEKLFQERAVQTQRILEDKQVALWVSLKDEAEKAAEKINSGGDNLIHFTRSEQDFRFVVRLGSVTKHAAASFDTKNHHVNIVMSPPSGIDERFQYIICANNDGQVEFVSRGAHYTPDKIIDSMLSWLV